MRSYLRSCKERTPGENLELVIFSLGEDTVNLLLAKLAKTRPDATVVGFRLEAWAHVPIEESKEGEAGESQ